MLNGVGDIVCVTPALEALKERYPGAKLSLIPPAPARPGRRQSRGGRGDRVRQGSLARRLAFLRDIRHRFDLWVDLHTPTFNTMTSNRRNFLRNALLMRWSGAPYRRGYAVAQLASHLTHPLPVPDESRLRVENVVALTLALAWPRAGRAYPKRFPVTGEERCWAEGALAAEGRRRVALFFGTGSPRTSGPRLTRRSSPTSSSSGFPIATWS